LPQLCKYTLQIEHIIDRDFLVFLNQKLEARYMIPDAGHKGHDARHVVPATAS
jgi:hypothetical protein